MRVLSVCMLLCCSLALAVASQPAPAMFSDWLEERTTVQGHPSPATVKPAAVPAYEEAGFEWGCLTEKKWGNCRAIGCGTGGNGTDGGSCWSTFYWESTLSCCEEKRHYDDYNREAPPSFFSNIEIGTCEFTVFSFGNNTVPVDSASDVEKTGTFQAVCNVHQGSQCDHPFCDGMVLSWKGTVFRTPAVSKTNPRAPPTDCTHNFTADTTTTPGGPTGTTARAEYGYRGDDEEPHTPPTFYRGTAVIYSGPAEVLSRKYNLKYHTAFIDFVSQWEPATPTGGAGTTPATVTPGEAASMHLVQPYNYVIRFNKEEHY